MKVLLFLSIVWSFCSLGFSAESMGYLKDPAHPGKCVYENLVLSPGEEGKLPGTCGRLLCGNDSWGTIHTCGVSIAQDGCKYTDYIDVDAPYSECCERKLVCEFENELNLK